MNLWLWESAHKAPRQLTRGDGGDYQPTWFPDGASLVFFSARAGRRTSGGSPSIAARSGSSPADSGMEINPFVSPDGSRLAYQSDRSGRLEVWVMNADGSEARQITSIGVFGAFPALDRTDGAAVLFRCPCGGRNVLYRVAADGGEPLEMPPIRRRRPSLALAGQPLRARRPRPSDALDLAALGRRADQAIRVRGPWRPDRLSDVVTRRNAGAFRSLPAVGRRSLVGD